ncbi:GerAB/ArcD/ProY family transporter [Paenibacillus gyeongsangnamensis]|uniref:GerAB/ArcD/ProY family transporter n=1 Tax=Paenibacillus gyeongsangnamensis TaxID=3388067 RepID=UPI0022B886E5|nr:GerAB/ArcD/ProY family transporter [Paenibacillus filicis]
MRVIASGSSKIIPFGDEVHCTWIEVLVATIWFISIYYRVTVFYYISIIGIAQVLELKDYRFLTLPLGAILVVFALVTRPNVAYSFEFLQAYTAFAPIIGIFFRYYCLLLQLYGKNEIINLLTLSPKSA